MKNKFNDQKNFLLNKIPVILLVYKKIDDSLDILLESKDRNMLDRIKKKFLKKEVDVPEDLDKELREQFTKKNLWEITHNLISPSLNYFKEEREIIKGNGEEDNLIRMFIENSDKNSSDISKINQV